MKTLAYIFLALLYMTVRAIGQGHPLPLQKGTKWIYEGQVKWDPAEGGKVKEKNVRWTMSVVSVRTNQGVVVALVSGFPDQLAWYEDGRKPALSVLLGMSNQVFEICSMCEKTPQQTAASILAHPPKIMPDTADLILDLPLRRGKDFGGETKREDQWYCWCVVDDKTQTLKVRGVDPKQNFKVHSVTYRTCPSHQIIEYAEGLGIIRYVYVHHGTVAEADVHLVEVQRK